MFSRIKKLFQARRPRYFYQLDEIKYHSNLKANLYIFKTYRSPTFAKWTFSEIRENKELRWVINPDDLIKIYLHEERHFFRRSMHKIKETLRNNHYAMTSNDGLLVFSGEEFCRNPAFIEKTSSLDVHKISYQTGFQAGRTFAKEMQAQIDLQRKKQEADNVVRLKINS